MPTKRNEWSGRFYSLRSVRDLNHLVDQEPRVVWIDSPVVRTITVAAWEVIATHPLRQAREEGDRAEPETSGS